MNLDDAIAHLHTALERFRSVEPYASRSLASRDYAVYAQAAYELRHAQSLLAAAQERLHPQHPAHRDRRSQVAKHHMGSHPSNTRDNRAGAAR
ncbi:hypothetical protein [Schauerella aestuarii]|uniref:hypothetical protein n=1 Tax=Schauerella aestuarii TaxID=2511204 RepID=UPI00136B8F39|nr:hypothetical protein [Achromobacter aestuarii]MYZ44623.1 hypothetical protein [Achromobacter aestuarii]